MSTIDSYDKAVVALQYVASSYESWQRVQSAFRDAVPLIKPQGIDILAQLMIVCVPLTIPLSEVAETMAVVLKDDESGGSEEFQVQLPALIDNVLDLPAISKAARQTEEYVEEQANKLGYPVEIPAQNSHEVFERFCKARILRHNSINPAYKLDDLTQNAIRSSPFFSDSLQKWIDGFYRPLTELANWGQSTALVDYVTYLSDEDQVGSIMEVATQSGSRDVIKNTLIPFLAYNEGMWASFNGWLAKFGDKTIAEERTTEMVLDYRQLLDLVREDSLLRAMPAEARDEFVSIIISTIYLCPKAILEVFVDAKEMIVTLKGLYPEETEGDKSQVIPTSPQSVLEMHHIIKPSRPFLDKCLVSIEAGQRLYANDLSLAEITNLSTADQPLQLAELHKFIDSESQYGHSSKQWEILLSSIYWVFNNSSIFGKIDAETLDTMVLTKLLDLKYFDILEEVFLAKYCKLPSATTKGIVMKYAWTYYRRATNCDPTIGSLKSSLQCANLVNTYEAVHLRNLIAANQLLLKWKLSFKPGVPVTPLQILDIADPYRVLYRVLELNDTAYKQSLELYELLVLLIRGLYCHDKDELFEYARERAHNVKPNPLLVKVKLVCLDFASPEDPDYAYSLAVELLQAAVENKQQNKLIFSIVSDKWLSFLQFVKGSGESSSLADLERKLAVLGQLILVTPTEFNIPVLEYWQLMNSEKEQMAATVKPEEQTQQGSGPFQSFLGSSGLGDLQATIHKSVDTGDIGRSLIGRIVGAQ